MNYPPEEVDVLLDNVADLLEWIWPVRGQIRRILADKSISDDWSFSQTLRAIDESVTALRTYQP